MALINRHNIRETIVFEITCRYNIELIYLIKKSKGNAPYTLLILVSKKYRKIFCKLVPAILNTVLKYPRYSVLCYITPEARRMIKAGNLFLFTSCSSQNLIYRNQILGLTLITDNVSFTECKNNALAFKEREYQKIDDYKDGYYLFYAKGKYSLASFMLHQTFETIYRYLELLLIAKERITHSIRSHHMCIKKISTIYSDSGVFNEDDPTDDKLLQKLGQIYRATRYEDRFKIKSYTLKRMEEKMELLYKNSELIIIDVLETFEHEYFLNAR